MGQPQHDCAGLGRRQGQLPSRHLQEHLQRRLAEVELVHHNRSTVLKLLLWIHTHAQYGYLPVWVSLI